MATELACSASTLPAPSALRVSEQPYPDLATCLQLINAGHAGEDPLPPEALTQLVTRDTSVFARAGARFFAGYRNEEVIGYASLLSLQGVGLIDTVATLPQHRRQGVATAVVGAVVRASATMGNHHTCLFTREGSRAQHLYTRLGLRTVARVAQFHRDDSPHRQPLRG